jgi:hypothetical protein
VVLDDHAQVRDRLVIHENYGVPLHCCLSPDQLVCAILTTKGVLEFDLG